MNSPRSVLLTTVGQATADARAIAADGGLRFVELSTISEPVIRQLIAAEPLAEGPALIEGTGNIAYDADAAAALGIPLARRPGSPPPSS